MSGGGSGRSRGRDGKDPSDTTLIVEMLQDAALTIFHSPEGEAYIVLRDRAPFVAWGLRGEDIANLAGSMFYEQEGRVPSGQSVGGAVRELMAEALRSGSEHRVFVRVAEVNGVVYLDLANASNEVGMVVPGAWDLTRDPDIYFRRPKGQLALPTPVRGGHLRQLRPFVNFSSPDEFNLMVTVVTSWLRPDIPQPVLVLHGEQGTAKTTTARLLKGLVDPSSPSSRTPPDQARDLMIWARNAWVMSIDNVDKISPKLSDGLCRISTGGGYATRRLYADAEEMTFDVMRPIVLNGIGQIASRGDLLDRAVMLELPSLDREDRMTVAELNAGYEAVRPKLLGALLDVVASGLDVVGEVPLPELPRMADFATWGYAVAGAIGSSGQEFLSVYEGNRVAALRVALEASPVGLAILNFVQEKGKWSGSMTALLKEIGSRVDGIFKGPYFPHTPAALGTQLVRLAPALLAHGVKVDRTRYGKGGDRIVTLTLVPAVVSPVSDVSPGAVKPPVKRGADDADGADEPPEGEPES